MNTPARPNPDWLPPPELLRLDSQSVHVWRVELDVPASFAARVRATLSPTLSDDERARSEGFHFHRDRTRYIAGRGVLRSILGRYLDIPPESVRFSYGPHGKPTLADPSLTGLRFNLAHAQGLAVVAVARGREVGIDVEPPRPGLDWEKLAKRFFSSGEVAALLALAPQARPRAFLRCWARKEAFVKARGLGLVQNLDEFEVSVGPDDPAAVLSIRDEPQEACRWSLRDLEPGGDYVGAVAAEGHDWHIEPWQWLWTP